MEVINDGQHADADSVQQAIVETVERIVLDSMRKQSMESKWQSSSNLAIDREITDSHQSVVYSENSTVICSPVSLHTEASWEEDEQEYKAQMHLLNADWQKPEVDEIMNEVLKGKLPFLEAAERISVILKRNIPAASVRNRALDCEQLSTASSSEYREEEEEQEAEEKVVEIHPLVNKKFGPGIYEVIRNIRGNMNSIAIKEPQSDCVRIYRRSTSRLYYSYYRCSTCDRLSRQIDLKSHLPPPIIKMVNDSIVGEPFPPHFSQCKPIPLSQLRAIQIDRENRQEVVDEMQTPFEAWSKGPLRALLEEAQRATQYAKMYRRMRKAKHRNRKLQESDEESHHFAQPYGENLLSFEGKLRRKLDERLKTSDFPTNPTVSGLPGTGISADDKSLMKRKRHDSSVAATTKDETRSLVSDLSEMPDDDGLLPDERAQIEHLKARNYNIESNKDDASSSEITARVTPLYLKRRTRGSETVEEGEVNADDISRDEYGKYQTFSTDSTGRSLIRNTKQKLFVVDDEHLLSLFRRCPDCGEQLKTLMLSSRKTVPVITYKCHGECQERIWFGYEQSSYKNV